MTTPDRIADALRAAVQIWDDTGHGADYETVARQIGVDPEVVLRELFPAISEYFEITLPGGDGIVVVRQPKATARQFVG